MKLKYVIINRTLPIMFGEYFNHSEVAHGLGTPTSAGFCHPNGDGSGGWLAYGESTSLNLKSDPERDSTILTSVFGTL